MKKIRKWLKNKINSFLEIDKAIDLIHDHLKNNETWIIGIDSRVTTAEQSHASTNSRVSELFGIVLALEEKVNLKLDKDEIIEAINTSSLGGNIKASEIHLGKETIVNKDIMDNNFTSRMSMDFSNDVGLTTYKNPIK